ncbi:hypothetical protein BKA82DRAFT_1005246 [Pisolithus tinctorius]|uniref:Uncharacterized protein n=1 Tax=Pisolithus tinctorius Marx 270 TaxID=870435 RepID=A0A0C3NST7_PISTI|nr:hypothetical protein BKA82DRAFT_1005246 [Pisolithus tinctorius]KIN98565.1 hypothetical protein M404DRAFT_1005246 [Pisolithus tinctorius Marx 270]
MRPGQGRGGLGWVRGKSVGVTGCVIAGRLGVAGLCELPCFVSHLPRNPKSRNEDSQVQVQVQEKHMQFGANTDLLAEHNNSQLCALKDQVRSEMTHFTCSRGGVSLSRALGSEKMV